MKSQGTYTHCSVCGTLLTGRKDKVFCSKLCKNEYHRRRKFEHVVFSKPIDRILHRNWVILAEQHDINGTNKFHVPLSTLIDAGFNQKYYTTTEVNSKGKTYHYIYNFGWMKFSDKELLVVRMEKPK